jgi:hypothetical protein
MVDCGKLSIKLLVVNLCCGDIGLSFNDMLLNIVIF